MVSELLHYDRREWNTELINATFLQFEAHQILQIPLSLNNRQDCFIWGANREGEFSVKSAYKFLKKRNEMINSNQSVIPQESNVWSKLWKLKTVPRHMQLIWRILHNRLPVRDSLFKRGVHCSPLCCICDQRNESINHLFMECEWVKTVWFATPLGINFSSNDEANLNFNEWISKVVINEDREVVQLVVAICYEIWRIRNKRCFEGIDMPYALSVCNSACKAIRILT
jgi:hypothetical protein